jgi:hypothetical protein
MFGERPALRVEKLRLGGFEAPFGCGPFDLTGVYLNAPRGELAQQRAPPRKGKRAGNILGDCGNYEKRKSSKSE